MQITRYFRDLKEPFIVYVDDKRSPEGEGIVIVRSSNAAILLINTMWHEIDEIHLDHDLGSDDAHDGMYVLNYIENEILSEGREHWFNVYVHTDNASVRRTMQRVADKLNDLRSYA